ncbi:Short-chain dehydrogenase/reductase SDR [Macrophomina phaseolina MS6]|uniref:Short-chain dehydrogenase/reductase SDR n=1 Tax=Macrophomina phaseolina (strain MS6) TaxID=1126212 RepID=K2SBK8_MACPH|nr:Short-chain dehydrogenase/reductase SDR [Macrophomina phaseolina MS6]
MSFFQAQIPPLPADISLRGQTIIVTGATGGIGYEASLQLLRLGAANLILAVRNIQKGSAARLSLLADEQVRATNPSATVKAVDLDLSDYQSVSAFASRVLKTEDRLDVLLLNAGINLAHFSRSVSGHEMCMQVNVLSNAVLSLLLLPLLLKTSRTSPDHTPTITWVGSLAQAFNSLQSTPLPRSAAILPHYASEAHYSRLRRYADTKLFVAMFVRTLAAHLPQGEAEVVVVNNVCPGTVDTGADNNLPFWLRIPMNLNRALRARSVEEGATAVLWAAVAAPERAAGGTRANGAYIADNAVSR